jgi:hypothetical protein
MRFSLELAIFYRREISLHWKMTSTSKYSINLRVLYRMLCYIPQLTVTHVHFFPVARATS